MKSIEIPLKSEKTKAYRFFETVPGILSWSVLLLPIILSLIKPLYAAIFIIAFLLMWFIKTAVLNIRMVQGYKRMKQHMAYDWQLLVAQLDNPGKTLNTYIDGIDPKWHYKNLIRQKSRPESEIIKSKDLIQVLIIAVYNETIDIVEPTINSILNVAYDKKKMIVIIAYEERGGEEVAKMTESLVTKYGNNFYHMTAVMHPKDMPNEVIGKGGNITYAGRWVKQYISKQKIDPKKTIVTTLDSDNRPHPQYFAAVSYAFIACPDPIHASFQPVSIFTNNIWDVPAPMRVVATGNSFWNIVLTLRPHMLRNFASHSQSLKTLIDTDFWSTRTIVEDGHQYWRTYFRYDGAHEVYPIMTPIYQDAVLAPTYPATLKAQFVQVRRWAYGASDAAYVLNTGFVKKNKIPLSNLIPKTARLIDGLVSWATAPLLILLGALAPLYINPDARLDFVANRLPEVASWIQRVAMIGLFFSIYYSIKLLPPKPARYKARHRVYLVLQWVLLPVTTIIYSSFAAINSQTRLIIGKYLDKFDVTIKSVKK